MTRALLRIFLHTQEKIFFLKDYFELIKTHMILTHESPLKIMKIAFYFILKALFVIKIFKFLKNGLLRKANLISKFMTSQPG